MIPLLIIGAIGVLALSNKSTEKGLRGVKTLKDNRYIGGKSSIEINTLKPSASIEAINKIIDNKVIYYDINIAKTGSTYLTFDVPQTDISFSIRVSNHSKINGNDDDTIIEDTDTISLNIFSVERKKEALEFLKNYFSKIKKLEINEKNIFVNKVEKKVLKIKYPELVENYFKKIGIDTSKTKKQVQEQVFNALLKMKPKGVLFKKEYSKSGGRFKLVKQDKIEGIITNISSTGNLVTINNETGKDFEFNESLHFYLKDFATGDGSDYWLELYLQKNKL